MRKIVLSLLFAVACISRVWAGDEPPTVESNKHLIDMVQSHADYVWTLVAAALVFFMQAGFAGHRRLFSVGLSGCLSHVQADRQNHRSESLSGRRARRTRCHRTRRQCYPDFEVYSYGTMGSGGGSAVPAIAADEPGQVDLEPVKQT
jgi:hypothetical protein